MNPYNIYPTNFIKTEGYPLMTRLQRRLYGIYTIYCLFFTIPLNCFFVLFYCNHFSTFIITKNFLFLAECVIEGENTYIFYPSIYLPIHLSVYVSIYDILSKENFSFFLYMSIYLSLHVSLSVFLLIHVYCISIYLSRG